MASIYLDAQSRNWKLKFLAHGKDNRVSLRKALPGENRAPVPADVAAMARDRGFDLSPHPAPAAAPPPPDPDHAPDDLLGFVDLFAADYARTHRPASIQRINGILRHYRRFLLSTPAPRLVAEVGESHILAWFEWRRSQVDPRLKIIPKPHVVVGESEQLSGLFKLAVERNKLPTNIAKRPLDKLRRAYPRPDPDDETKYLDPDQRARFLGSIDEAVAGGKVPQDYADLARVMLSTGLRVEAALHLDYSWISRDWVVRVPAEYDKCKTGYTTVVESSGRAVLGRRRGLQAAGPAFPPGMTQALSYYHLRKLGVTNHMLRHSFATALVDAKVPIQTIGSLMGHKNIKTTQRYAKVREQAKVDAVALLNFGIPA